jgi:hypothetical protein
VPHGLPADGLVLSGILIFPDLLCERGLAIVREAVVVFVVAEIVAAVVEMDLGHAAFLAAL